MTTIKKWQKRQLKKTLLCVLQKVGISAHGGEDKNIGGQYEKMELSMIPQKISFHQKVLESMRSLMAITSANNVANRYQKENVSLLVVSLFAVKIVTVDWLGFGKNERSLIK